jgi:nitroreductase
MPASGFVLSTERALYPWAVFDLCLMAQTICLAALAYGLGTCLMTRAVNWSDIYRELIGIPKSKLIVLGIAIGYPDDQSVINSCPRYRVPLDVFTQWHGWQT